MNALERVRKRFGSLRLGTDTADKSPSVTSVSPSHRESQSFSAATPESEARLERAAIMEYDDGLSREEAEQLAGLRATFPIAAKNCSTLVTCNTCLYFNARPAAQPDGWCNEHRTEAWSEVPFDCPSYARRQQ